MMEKKRLTFRQELRLFWSGLTDGLPRRFFVTFAAASLFYLGAAVYVVATGRSNLVLAVLARVAVFGTIAVIAAAVHRLGNPDHAWTYYMFWKKKEGSMTVHQLYRSRIMSAVIFAVIATVLGIFGFAVDPTYLIFAGMAAFAAATTLWLARDSYRFDIGLAGPPEWRQLVRDADDWAKNGYRNPEEIAAGVPPRTRPPSGPLPD